MSGVSGVSGVRPGHVTPVTPALVHGALELEPTARGLRPHRLPARARGLGVDDQLRMVEAQPSGVRLRFRTAATVVELVTVPTKRVYPGLPARPDGVYDLLVDGRPAGRTSVAGGDTLTVDLATQTTSVVTGAPGTARFDGLPAVDKTVEVWLPHDEATELVELRTDAPVHPAPATGRPVWLHHGSSISQGSGADGPTGTWPAVAAAAVGVDLVNVGLGGSMLLDPSTARALAATPADLLSLEVGINVVGADVMRLRAFRAALHGFLDTLRDGHPTAPLVLVSPLLCPVHEDTPGPGAFDLDALREGRVRFRASGDPADVPAGRLTLRVVRDEVARAVAERQPDDPALHLVDGRALYGEEDERLRPLPDGLHPDAATHREVGRRFARLVGGPGGAFSGTPAG
ncbi:GDSL-type esterase/lipase family protein [Aquipuribacter hungaricus]|uniref:GDSL-type esterase/lipase family protein n=1 Tax=Aquipuribacter hungaricus TaxID=545624 RepID=A0ABV7WHD7_9MICO